MIFFVLGAICIVIFSFFYYTKKHNKTVVPLTELTAGETKIDTIEGAKYFGLLKEHLKEEWLKKGNAYLDENPAFYVDYKVGSIKEEDGNLTVRDLNGDFLSSYSYLSAFEGDLDNDGISEIIITIADEGGGTGGNFEIQEHYIFRKNNSEGYNISFLSIPKEAPEGLSEAKSQMEMTDYIVEKIENGFVNLSIGNPGHYYKDKNGEDQLEEIIVKCKLIGNKLKIVN